MCLSDYSRLFLLLASLLFPAGAFALPRPALSQSVEVQMAPEVTSGGEQVVLGDVAAIYARSMADFRVLSGLVLAQMPEDKKDLRLPASYIEQRIREALPPGTELALHLPPVVSFRLQRIGMSQQEFASEVLRLARAEKKIPEGVEAEVLPVSGFEQLKLLRPENARIEPAGEMERWKGEISFKVSRTDSDGAKGLVWVKVKVRWFQDAWVASRRLAFSQALGPELFTRSRVETTALREEPLAASSEELAKNLKNARARRTIAENAPLFLSAIERKPDALPGQALRVIFQSESGVSVSADGALLGAGTIGSEVKARLRSSKKIVVGKLVSEGVVEVNL